MFKAGERTTHQCIFKVLKMGALFWGFILMNLADIWKVNLKRHIEVKLLG